MEGVHDIVDILPVKEGHDVNQCDDHAHVGHLQYVPDTLDCEDVFLRDILGTWGHVRDMHITNLEPIYDNMLRTY